MCHFLRDHEKSTPMQVILESFPTTDENPVVVETSPKATVATLISSYCSQKDVAFNAGWVIIDDKERTLPQFSTLGSLGIVDGQRLKITFKNQSLFSKKKWPFMIALAGLVICVAGILIISMLYGLTGGKYLDDYGVVMDAGSSKTNTTLYSWKSNKHKGTGYVTQVKNCNFAKGIAEMDPMELDPVINCAKEVTQRVDPSVRSKTPLYFAATAGMRLLNFTDPDRTEEILEQLSLNLTKTGLSVNAIEIISGQQEGIYGWITANFLKQTLEIPQKEKPWIPTTYGALDMGGASVQISYALPEELVTNTSDIVPLMLYGQTHNLFAYSNLCFGRSEAESRYRNLLITDVTKTDFEDPCVPLDYIYNKTGEELFSRYCTESNRFAVEIKKDPKIMDQVFTFTGTSKPNFCKGNVSRLLDIELCQKSEFKECFRKAENIPDKQKYLAFATYFFTTDFLNVTNTTMQEFEHVVEQFCLKNVTEVERITKKKYGKQYCFNAEYIHEVLTTGFGINATTWSNIEFVGEIAGKDVGWPLGYMINATNMIPEKGEAPRLISATVLTVCLILFIIIVIGAIIFILRKQHIGYTDYRR